MRGFPLRLAHGSRFSWHDVHSKWRLSNWNPSQHTQIAPQINDNPSAFVAVTPSTAHADAITSTVRRAGP